MLVFVAGLIVFFGIHSVRIVAPGLRDAGIAGMGERGWKGAYSLISLVGLGLILWGWTLYRPGAAIVYDPPGWGRHLAMALVWAGFVLLVAAYAPVGHIARTVRHPMLLGVGLWALGHLLSNGDLASLVLFGAFLVYAAIDIVSATLRRTPPPVLAGVHGDVIALVGGSLAYAAFLIWLHGWLFGVSPIA